MDRIVTYLEKLGYTAEEAGGLVEFIVIFKDSLPIGFILPDMSVSLVRKDDEETIVKMIDFVKQNQQLELVAGSEYVVATFKNHKLTTYYDAQSKTEKYVAYIIDDTSGSVTSSVFDDNYTAVINFAIMSQMLNADDIRKGEKGNLKDKMINKAINYLMARKTNS